MVQSPHFSSTQFYQRAKWFYFLIIFSFIILWARCYYIQIFRHQDFKKLAKKRHQVKIPTHGERGKIYSHDGTLYALSLQSLSLYANPKTVQNEKEVAYCLGNVLQKNPKTIYNALMKKTKSFVWIQRKLTPKEVITIEELGIIGIGFRAETNRFYPRKKELCHLLGFANIDNTGKEGLELVCNKELSGKDGFRWALRDARQHSIQMSGAKEVVSEKGSNIRLTIDSTIQYILEEELQKINDHFKPKSVSGIVLNPETGAILAIGAFPNYDPNYFNKFTAMQRKNTVLVDAYEPGSTFKSFIASSVLEEKLFKVTDVIFCENGRFKVKGRRPLRDYHAYGDLEFWEVIAKSSNIGCAKMAIRLGPEKFSQWIHKFGFGQSLKGLLPSHSRGGIKPLKRWSEITLYSVQMGHELMATPLQLARAYTTFANGGYLVEPYVVEQIISPDEGILFEGKTEKKKILSEETIQKMNYVLARVFTDGTARRVKVKGYTLAGKTGTTEKVNPKTKRYYKNRNITSFMAFGPVGRTKLVTLVVADDPKAQGGAHATGGHVAAPAVTKIMEKALHYLEVPMEAETYNFDDFPTFLENYYHNPSFTEIEVFPTVPK